MDYKVIPNFSKYRIDSKGQVVNKHGMCLSDHDCNGYRRISLENDKGKRTGVDIHRLVASTWIGPIPKGMWVSHEDGDKTNNDVNNLKIDTPSYNHKHAWRLGLNKGNTMSVKRDAVKALSKLGWSQHKIATAFACSQPNISNILNDRK